MKPSGSEDEIPNPLCQRTQRLRAKVQTPTPNLGSGPRSVSSEVASVMGKYVSPQAGTEPTLGGRPAEPGGTPQGLECSLQQAGFAVQLFFSVQSPPLALWVAQVPHSSPLCPSDLDACPA